MDVFIHPNTPFGDKLNSKILKSDFNEKNYLDFEPKNFTALAQINDQIAFKDFDDRITLKKEWEENKQKLLGKIVQFFSKNGFEIIKCSNFCNKTMSYSFSKLFVLFQLINQ